MKKKALKGKQFVDKHWQRRFKVRDDAVAAMKRTRRGGREVLYLVLARKFRDAVNAYGAVYDDVDKVRGLDEFDPKHIAWENRLFFAENEKEAAKDALLAAARYL